MKLFSKYFLFIGLSLSACTYTPADEPWNNVSGSGPVKVGLSLSGDNSGAAILTRTAAGEDGLTTRWEAGDRIAVWARSRSGAQVLSGTPFTAYAISEEKTFFTATLSEAMPDGQYTYYAAYPLPEQISGTTATFSIPATQDGRSGRGEDIMVSSSATAGPLQPMDWMNYGHDELLLGMNHLLHRLRFYVEDLPILGGEAVQRIVADFPRDVTGKIQVDITAPSAREIASDGASRLVIQPEEPVALSETGAQRNYLTASILPSTFAAEENLSVTLYTETKIARMAVPLQGRTFAAGHSTPVKLVPQQVGTLCRVYVRLDENHLGEDIQSLTLTAPAGCKWGDSLSNEFTYTPGGEFGAGTAFVLEFEDEQAFRSLSGKHITATYESAHVIISEELDIESLDGKYATTLRLQVPYLFEEDFSSVGTFSYDDQYTGGFNTGSKSAHSFMNGWTGARIGAEAGKCIRIACRRETSANYSARVDAAPLRGTLKSPANLHVEFDYGADNQFGGIAIITDPDVGQTCFVGYVTSSGGYKSGDTTGTFEDGNSFYVKEYTGSYTSTPNTAEYTIHNAPQGNAFRLTIRTEIESRAGTTNTTAWLYIDNIKISIAK